MPLYAPKPEESMNFDPVPAGSHIARCYSVVDIGTSTFEYEGQQKSLHKLRITFELPEETKVFKEENGEQPHVISVEYTLSMHERSSLRQALESWRGKKFNDEEVESFDITTIVTKPAMLNVVHTNKNGKTFASIASISPLPKSVKCPEQVNKSVILTYDIPIAEYNEIFCSLPQFLQEKIKQTPEYDDKIKEAFEKTTKTEPDTEEVNIDDISF